MSCGQMEPTGDMKAMLQLLQVSDAVDFLQ